MFALALRQGTGQLGARRRGRSRRTCILKGRSSVRWRHCNTSSLCDMGFAASTSRRVTDCTAAASSLFLNFTKVRAKLRQACFRCVNVLLMWRSTRKECPQRFGGLEAPSRPRVVHIPFSLVPYDRHHQFRTQMPLFVLDTLQVPRVVDPDMLLFVQVGGTSYRHSVADLHVRGITETEFGQKSLKIRCVDVSLARETIPCRFRHLCMSTQRDNSSPES